MGKYVQWITHKGVRILFLNGRGLEEAEHIAALEELNQELLKSRTGPPMLFDLTNTSMTPKTTAKAKEMDAAAKAAGVVDGPGAVVGLSKLAKLVAQVFGRKTHYFDTIEEAKEWLVNESKKARQGSGAASCPEGRAEGEVLTTLCPAVECSETSRSGEQLAGRRSFT